MNNNPKISVITVVFNDKIGLENTIKSVISQTYSNIEYIVIDGVSVDGTLDIIRKYKHWIDYYLSEPDEGIYDAMNKGVDCADDGGYLHFLNAGDMFADDNVLENLSLKMVSANYIPMVVYGNTNVHNKDGAFVGHLKAWNLTKNSLNKFATRVVCHQSIFVYKPVAKKYNLSYRLKAELNWYYDIVNIVDECNILKIDMTICNYLTGGEGDNNFLENFWERIKVTYNNNNLLSFILNFPFFLIPVLYRIKRKFSKTL
jgi:glycosyltransferase involved in cell wall biosynthesis